MNRYDIKPEGLGEINIDLSDNGDWVRFDDIEHLFQKKAHNSEYMQCQDTIVRNGIKQCRECGKPL